MNKKGQSIYGLIVFLIFFIAVWAFWFGEFLQTWGANAIEQNAMTGIEAMLYANLNVVVFIALLIFIYISIKIGV